MDTLAKAREACRLRAWMPDNREFVEAMADIFSAKPAKGNSENLYHFLQTIYNAGRVDGIRGERAKRRRQMEKLVDLTDQRFGCQKRRFVHERLTDF